jgi:tetratricopeptide (TPR) repeat protein
MTRPSDDPFPAALTAHRRGDLNAALAGYRACLSRTPDDPEVLRLLGLALYQGGDSAAARNVLTHAAALQPSAGADLALVLLDQGEAEAALTALDAAIAATPGDSDAWSRRGRALLALSRPGEAVESLERAVDLAPLCIEAIFNLGCAELALARWDAARDCFDAILSLAADHAAAWNNRGIALLHRGRPGVALSSFEASLERRPDHPETLFNRAAALTALGRSEEALATLDHVLSLIPGHRAARLERARLRARAGRLDEALADLDAALAENPRDADVLYNRGTLFARKTRFADAVRDLAAAAEIAPGDADIRENLALALVEDGRPQEALDAAEAGLAAAPGHPGLLNAKGEALVALGRLAEALALHQAAVASAPTRLNGWHDLGLVLDDLGRPEEALIAYDRALALSPGDPDVRLCRALSRLALGDFAAAWPDFSCRFFRKRRPVARRGSELPEWDGRPLEGTLLLTAEQGYGDTLQFGRFIPLATQRVGRLTVSAPQPLLRLLAVQPGIAEATAAETCPADAACPLPDLPRLLGPAPVAAAWLTAPPEAVARWTERLAALPRPRIGIAWHGRAETRTGPHLARAVPLSRLLAVLPARAALVPLQKEVTPEDAKILSADARACTVSPEIEDFADVAGIAAAMDLIVSIDSAPAHLALAMGRPTWVLLPFSADWRWGLPGRASPWYPDAQRFRQTVPGEWDEPLAALAEAFS